MIAALLAFPFLSSLLSERSSSGDEAGITEVPVFEYLESGDYRGLAQQNTFMFRIALTAERFEYLIDHPESTLFGVGAMHEETAQKKFDFIVGTAGTLNGRPIKGQLNSIDVTWGPLLIRYGIMGLILHLFIIFWMVIKFYKKRENPIMMLGFLTYISALAQSFSSGGTFFLFGIMTMMFFLIAYDKKIEV